MFNPIITANIFSKLGNSSSLLPMIVKDAAHSAGMTTSSYITGKEVEGKDRLIDEAGAALIWVGGIPFYKKLIDLSLYKIAGHNPNIDVRVLKDKKILEMAKKYAPTEKVMKTIEKAANQETKFKGLFMAKFIAATVMTLASYWGLTVFRHNHTEKKIIELIKKEETKKQAKEQYFQGKEQHVFKPFQKNNKKQHPAFGMNMSVIKDFMFNPVKNMMIVDGGITAERLGESRNPQDLLGYIIKEGSFWGFMYFAGPYIQKQFEKIAVKKHNKSIDLDIKVLNDKEFKEAFKDGTQLLEDLKEIKNIQDKDKLFEALCTKDNNLVVKAAKKAGIIKLYKENNKVDTQQFIDLDMINGTKESPGIIQKIETLLNQYKDSEKLNKETLDQFFEKVIKLKKGSIIKNIGTCMGVLGVVVPGIMLISRIIDKDNKEFQVKKEVHEKLKKEKITA